MRPGELLSRLFWRGVPIALVVWAVRSGAVDVQRYVRLIAGEPRSPAQLHLEAISAVLVNEYKREHRLPEGYQLPWFLLQSAEAKAISPRPDLDPFGNALRIRRIPDGFVLTSDGPDRKADTADDIAHVVKGLEKLALE